MRRHDCINSHNICSSFEGLQLLKKESINKSNLYGKKKKPAEQ